MPDNTIQKINEEALVARLRASDNSAVSLLYDMYSATLYGVILQIVKTEEVAEDVLQEAFIKIWKSFDKYDETKGRLFTWMINICRNLAIDKIRSREHRMKVSSDTIPEKHRPEFTRSAFNPDHIGVRDVVEQLSPDQKKIIDLMYFEGLTQSEIAKEYNIPLGTVKTRARSAVKLLSKLFKGSV
ncbi:RNA polymerase sigma factor [Pontibacter anaerobius]|uniref:Sigma-70 family RNA polymerase sigma factor n=1 Tax=Pontibacter anaerobius TaxID=2993940 RepID=A0ABT3RH22_9BACT|nr:sigma-70 family RNA polymerase sigma factor [Pontibacter anaerobius]MCX2740922.1 sigma-70 family RNA polymerase sigma factor [Pontibacter anaerobius]